MPLNLKILNISSDIEHKIKKYNQMIDRNLSTLFRLQHVK